MGYIRKAIAKGISKEYKKQIMNEAIGMEEKIMHTSKEKRKVFQKKLS